MLVMHEGKKVLGEGEGGGGGRLKEAVVRDKEGRGRREERTEMNSGREGGRVKRRREGYVEVI